MECQYCKIFQSARLREERNKENWRHCREIGEWVTFDSKWCKEFELPQFFYCDKTNHRLDYVVCIERQNKEECKCKQGRKIKEMKKGLRNGRRAGIKVDKGLIKRRKSE